MSVLLFPVCFELLFFKLYLILHLKVSLLLLLLLNFFFYSSVGKENMHVIQVPTSPSFLKPKPIRLKKRCKKPDVSLPLKDIDINSNKHSLGYLIKSPKIPVNPFR